MSESDGHERGARAGGPGLGACIGARQSSARPCLHHSYLPVRHLNGLYHSHLHHSYLQHSCTTTASKAGFVLHRQYQLNSAITCDHFIMYNTAIMTKYAIMPQFCLISRFLVFSFSYADLSLRLENSFRPNVQCRRMHRGPHRPCSLNR